MNLFYNNLKQLRIGKGNTVLQEHSKRRSCSSQEIMFMEILSLGCQILRSSENRTNSMYYRYRFATNNKGATQRQSVAVASLISAPRSGLMPWMINIIYSFESHFEFQLGFWELKYWYLQCCLSSIFLFQLVNLSLPLLERSFLASFASAMPGMRTRHAHRCKMQPEKAMIVYVTPESTW